VGGRNLALIALGNQCRFIGSYAGDDRQLRPNPANGNATWRKMNQGIVTRLDITNNAAEIHNSFVLASNLAVIPN
jgi:hypothetical protein